MIELFQQFICSRRNDKAKKKKSEDTDNSFSRQLQRVFETIPYDLGSRDKIFIPMNEVSHWYLLTIDLKKKIFLVYNSIKGHHTSSYINTMVTSVKKYFSIHGIPDCDTFQLIMDNECPQQKNSYDCGLFVIKFMDCLSQGDRFYFNSGDMQFERKKIAAQLLLGKISP
ncbi:putative ubiquitin-like-specific protease 1B isoform X2 [Magnolia sinica]|uniref:putative ubiquitin-like-specific protease 1B isoform X2 n=1 Tax=Magnolia sinica TaxID=86752 RepID=UPI002657D6A8|nr:putative ubiquitin-like-specific protease 1B isoform X2 [Magnolia sinica]